MKKAVLLFNLVALSPDIGVSKAFELKHLRRFTSLNPWINWYISTRRRQAVLCLIKEINK